MARGRGRAGQGTVGAGSSRRSPGVDAAQQLSDKQRRELGDLMATGNGATLQSWLDLETAACLERIQDLGPEQLEQGLRMMRARSIFGNGRFEMKLHLLQEGALADPSDCLEGTERVPDKTKALLTPEIKLASSRAIALRRALTLAESARATLSDTPHLPDVHVTIPVNADAFAECRGRPPFTGPQEDGDHLDADFLIADDYRLGISLVLCEDTRDNFRGVPLVNRMKMADRAFARPSAASSLHSALGQTYCPHASGRWVPNEGVAGPDALVLECEDCLLAEIAIVPLHQVHHSSSPWNVEQLDEMIEIAHGRAYLKSQAYYQAIAGDMRPIKNHYQLVERDGYIDLDPSKHAVGVPPSAARAPMSVAAAMKRR